MMIQVYVVTVKEHVLFHIIYVNALVRILIHVQNIGKKFVNVFQVKNTLCEMMYGFLLIK